MAARKLFVGIALLVCCISILAAERAIAGGKIVAGDGGASGTELTPVLSVERMPGRLSVTEWRFLYTNPVTGEEHVYTWEEAAEALQPDDPVTPVCATVTCSRCALSGLMDRLKSLEPKDFIIPHEPMCPCACCTWNANQGVCICTWACIKSCYYEQG